jgi:tetratricopeptide (TPR) repeat protein
MARELAQNAARNGAPNWTPARTPAWTQDGTPARTQDGTPARTPAWTQDGIPARTQDRIPARTQDRIHGWARCRGILLPVLAGLALAPGALPTLAVAAGKAAEDKATAPAEAGEAGKSAGPATAKKKPDPVEAQRAVDNAAKLLAAGKTDQAIQALSATLASGNMPPAIMAKALFYRGTAYRQQKKPAQAIADFTSALWLKGGLSESDRAEGLRQRAAAYAEAGLNQGGDISPAGAVKPTPGKERTASPATPVPWSDGTSTSAPPTQAALVQEPSAAPATGGGFNLFANLFGGGPGSSWAAQSAAAPAAPRPDPAAISNAESSTAERSAAARPSQASAWSRQTQVESPRAARLETAAITTKDEPPRRATPEPEAPGKAGYLRIQIAAVRTPAEAQALAAKVMREHASTLAKREPQIDQTVMGNMGSFYRVLIGPFASPQETQSICAKLKGTGLDCLVTAQ